MIEFESSHVIILICGIVIGVVVMLLVNKYYFQKKDDSFGIEKESYAERVATQLTQKGCKMYGKQGCPYCEKQKNEFGDAFSKINYIECTENEEECKNIDGVPFWSCQTKTLKGFRTLQDLEKEFLN